MTDALDSETKENARTYRSTPTSEMVVDNTLITITKWQYIWKNSNPVFFKVVVIIDRFKRPVFLTL